MGCFPRHKNRVGPVGPLMTPPKSAKNAKPKRKGSASSNKSLKSFLNFFTSIVSIIICTKSSGTKVVPFKQTDPVSMYPEDDSSESSYEMPGPCRPRRNRPQFEEVELALPGQVQPSSTDFDTDTGPASNAKLSVPISALPGPNEYSTSQDQRSNVEIIREFRDNGLSGYVQSAVVGENVKPGGVSFEVRVTTIRPKTAKGPRPMRPPRRLERLEAPQMCMREHSKAEAALKSRVKQEKAARKRQAIQEERLEKKKEKSIKHKAVTEAIEQASEEKKKMTAEKLQLKEERARSARISQLLARQQKDEIRYKRRQLALKSKQLSLGCPGEALSPDSASKELDKISTYGGSSSGSDNAYPLYYETHDYLTPGNDEDKFDEFFDGPAPSTENGQN